MQPPAKPTRAFARLGALCRPVSAARIVSSTRLFLRERLLEHKGTARYRWGASHGVCLVVGYRRELPLLVVVLPRLLLRSPSHTCCVSSSGTTSLEDGPLPLRYFVETTSRTVAPCGWPPGTVGARGTAAHSKRDLEAAQSLVQAWTTALRKREHGDETSPANCVEYSNKSNIVNIGYRRQGRLQVVTVWFQSGGNFTSNPLDAHTAPSETSREESMLRAEGWGPVPLFDLWQR